MLFIMPWIFHGDRLLIAPVTNKGHKFGNAPIDADSSRTGGTKRLNGGKRDRSIPLAATQQDLNRLRLTRITTSLLGINKTRAPTGLQVTNAAKVKGAVHEIGIGLELPTIAVSCVSPALKTLKGLESRESWGRMPLFYTAKNRAEDLDQGISRRQVHASEVGTKIATFKN